MLVLPCVRPYVRLYPKRFLRSDNMFCKKQLSSKSSLWNFVERFLKRRTSKALIVNCSSTRARDSLAFSIEVFSIKSLNSRHQNSFCVATNFWNTRQRRYYVQGNTKWSLRYYLSTLNKIGLESLAFLVQVTTHNVLKDSSYNLQQFMQSNCYPPISKVDAWDVDFRQSRLFFLATAQQHQQQHQ